ncbi:MAG: beta-propeller domain-containing protein [Clostridia bacterium]|nr:beta-propeller domain-containing protein [Clostridia bacterium]
MNNDMNFESELKERFEKEAPGLPETLKKENVMKMLENDNYTPKKKKHIFAKVLAVAASLVIICTSVYALPLIIPEKGLKEAFPNKTVYQSPPEYEIIDNGFKATKLMQAESTEALKNHFLRVHRENQLDDFIDSALSFDFYYKTADGAAPESYNVADGVMNESAVMTTVAATQSVVNSNQTAAAPQKAPEVADDVVSVGDALTGSPNYGKTNTQVENVDEADIIKNDGRYIYILSGGTYKVERRVTILSAADMKVVSRIILDSDDYYYNIQEMYVNGDRLVLLASESEKYKESDDERIDVAYPNTSKGSVVSFVYDISDRENPEFVRKVSQDGYEYVSSRMIDGILYTVSNYRVRGNTENEIKENAIPEVNGKEIACDCIYIYDYDSKSYNILTAYDTRLDDGEVNSVSVLGSGHEVYCSEDALYVANGSWDYDKGNFSEIYSFSLDGVNIAYKASGTVKGSFLNRFSFDEYEGNLRVATTDYSYVYDNDVSSIYVLNKDLELIGKLEDIAYDEQVKSVRFMGDTGFIVTFRNTDPLFTLDLSDPTAPKVVGEVKLPGFSSYLHPVGEGLVVGLGYDGDEENADFNTVKVSLFDVSDLKNPKEVDTFVLKNAYSTALSDPKAFISYPEEKLIGFPVEHYDGRTVYSYKLLKIDNNEISNHLGYVHHTERYVGDVFRGTYIDDKLYTIDNYYVCEFDIATAEMLRECEILDVEDDWDDYGKYKYDGEVYTTPAYAPGMVVATTVSVDSALTDSVAVDTTVGVTVRGTTTTAPAVVATAPTTEIPKTPEYTFEALVVKVLDNSLLVEVTAKGDSGLSVGTQASFSTVLTGIEAGDTVKVIYDGTVQETYPVSLPNVLSIGVSKE